MDEKVIFFISTHIKTPVANEKNKKPRFQNYKTGTTQQKRE